ncbi:MAG: hypothetical protein ABIH03_01675 [Pseudomonadota bacterium]
MPDPDVRTQLFWRKDVEDKFSGALTAYFAGNPDLDKAAEVLRFALGVARTFHIHLEPVILPAGLTIDSVRRPLAARPTRRLIDD